MKTQFELLSNFDLINYCNLFKINLVDVLSKDEFKDIQPKKGCYIINLQDTNMGNGTHWVALYLDDIAVYYNSFGIAIPQSILKFVKRYDNKIKIIYSIDQIQHMESIFCGWFCIYFLYFFDVLHKKCNNYKYLLNKHNSIFSMTNKYLNDRILRKLISNIVE